MGVGARIRFLVLYPLQGCTICRLVSLARRRPARGRALLEWSVVGLTLFTPSTTREGFLGTETRGKRWLVMAKHRRLLVAVAPSPHSSPKFLTPSFYTSTNFLAPSFFERFPRA